MKNLVRLVTLGAIASVALFSGAAFADTAMVQDSMHSSGMPSSMMMMHPPAAMILTVDTKGNGRLRGVVATVGTTSITVAGWGGVWTILTTGNTSMSPKNMVFSDIKVGDYVGTMGTVSEDGPTLTATLIRDFTGKKNAMMQHDTMKKDAMMKDDHMTAATGTMTH